MKANSYAPGLLIGTAVILFSCKKVDVRQDGYPSEKQVGKKSSCFVTSLESSNAFTSQTVFKTTFNANGNAFRIEAGTYSGGVINSTVVLNVVYSDNSISFVNAAASSDTLLVATLNSRGKVQYIKQGNKPDANFVPINFDYVNDRVSALHVSFAGNVETSNFAYDNRDNVVSISDEATPSVPVPGKIVYEYSNKRAGQQFYMDEPRKFTWNSFTLLQYAGLFPELNPSNVRTSTKVWWGNNYKAYDMRIDNQKVDGNNNRTSYDVLEPNSGKVINTFNLGWSCAN